MINRIIIGPAYPLRGGISESNHSLKSTFEKRNCSTKIVSYSLQYPNFLFPGRNQFMDDVDQSPNTFSLINTLNPLSWIKTARWISNEKPDYLIVRYWHPYFAICLSFILKMIGKKNVFIIAWIDNVSPHESMPFQKFLTSLFLKSCHTFLVMSKSVKNELMTSHSICQEKILVHPHPIYDIFGKVISKKTAKSNLGISCSTNNDKYILFFGLIRKYKGLDLLLEVMASKKITALNLKLIIAGEFYDDRDRYLSKINSLNLKERVIMHDFYIKNENVVNYFCASDIVVQPYISATQSGVSMVAYNFNKPILLTNVGGLSEYVDDKINGYLVEPNVDSIVLALEDFYLNQREKNFSDIIQNKKSYYSWDSLCNNFDNLYEKSNFI